MLKEFVVFIGSKPKGLRWNMLQSMNCRDWMYVIQYGKKPRSNFPSNIIHHQMNSQRKSARWSIAVNEIMNPKFRRNCHFMQNYIGTPLYEIRGLTRKGNASENHIDKTFSAIKMRLKSAWESITRHASENKRSF